MDCQQDGAGASVQYALVCYIPDALGDFLNHLREELVPSCRLLSHITLLPPRFLTAPPATLVDELATQVRHLIPFRIQLGSVEKFNGTDVVYVAVQSGAKDVEAAHARLSQGMLASQENFEFHPHITLAQEIKPELVALTFQRAQERWAEWKGESSFVVDNLTFVRNIDPNTWQTVAEFTLD